MSTNWPDTPEQRAYDAHVMYGDGCCEEVDCKIGLLYRKAAREAKERPLPIPQRTEALFTIEGGRGIFRVEGGPSLEVVNTWGENGKVHSITYFDGCPYARLHFEL